MDSSKVSNSPLNILYVLKHFSIFSFVWWCFTLQVLVNPYFSLCLMNSLSHKPYLLILFVPNSLPWSIWSIISFFNGHIYHIALKSYSINAIVFSLLQLTYYLPAIIHLCTIRNSIDLQPYEWILMSVYSPSKHAMFTFISATFLSVSIFASLKVQGSCWVDNCAFHFPQMCTRMPSIFSRWQQLKN